MSTSPRYRMVTVIMCCRALKPRQQLCPRLFSGPIGVPPSPPSRSHIGKVKPIVDASRPDHCLSLPLPPAAHSGLPPRGEPYLVLGIETSCDDTGVAVLRSNGEILSNIVISQCAIHERYGGIVPNLAMIEHKKNIDVAVQQALERAGVTMADISGVGVTQGPGLEVCLRVGVRKAQALCTEWGKPLTYVNHLEAHCLSARLTSLLADYSGKTKEPVRFPFLALLVSGGHTSLVVCRGVSDYALLGSTLDDALGEAFDKASRMLHLSAGSNGGAMIETAARNGRAGVFKFPIPLQKRYSVEKLGESTANKQVVSDMCAAFQDAAFRHIRDRIGHAFRYTRYKKIPISSLVVVGGVASNEELRRTIREFMKTTRNISDVELIFPPPALCTDNGVMIAWAAVEKFNLGVSDVIDGPDVHPRWPMGQAISEYGPKLENMLKLLKKQDRFNA